MDRYAARAAQFDASPYAQLLGMKVVELAEGRVVIEMPLREEYLNWAGITHGGAIMSLADHAFGCALNTGDLAYVAVQFNTSFVAAPRVGEVLQAEGRVLHAGRKIGMVQITVKDSSGRLIATASGTSVAVERRQP